MIHRCICSRYSLKAPPTTTTQKRQKGMKRPQPAQPLPPREEGATGRPAPNTRLPGGGCRADLAIKFHVSANKVLKTSVPLPREGGEEDTEMLAVLSNAPRTSPRRPRVFARQGRVCYHSFFFSSMETPPGPRATTRSRPPITDMVWKKSYLRKSCMGL